ncbi:MAG TPA: MBL fold metallo-hydrolase [Tepidisphaeraceae bacterium]|nr:MBL fold metallo-hydrolase [Tepidisphaeraceae bacterium]
MRIQFCGADRTVTGSSHLIESNNRRVLLDCGMYQGPRDEADRLNHYLPDNATGIDAVILSHGHLDHCGKLPELVRRGYHGPIYCTPATAAVTRVVLEDSAKIQQENAEYLNRRTRPPGQPPIEPLYTSADVAATMNLLKLVPYAQPTAIADGITFTFFDAGHILGSAYVIVDLSENNQPKRLLFTADVGRYNAPILRDPAPVAGPCDIIITESTYGNSLHGPMELVEPQFLDAVKFCVDHKSRLLVPSFAVGRTQTVLWYMEKFISEQKIPPIPIYVDSPMGVEISHIHSEFRNDYDRQTNQMIGSKDLFGLSRVTFASSVDESKKINLDPGPCVIIASSPSCEFGRILHHLKQSVERPNDLVTFVGWIPPQTLGRRLQDGDRRVKIFDQWFDVKCQVRTIHGMSAHADASELIRFLTPALTKDSRVYVVHGEVPQAEALAQSIRSAGPKCVGIPAMETEVLI